IVESLSLEKAQLTRIITSGKMNINARILPKVANFSILGSLGVTIYWLYQLNVIAVYAPDSMVVMVRSV
ncbi:MAG: hypothetical protein OEW84_02610, partial [Aigarchaeota archaeon]|nr:hypothetical protein [Aigarchaeota archaeon]